MSIIIIADFQNASKICNFQKTRKKEIMHTRKLRTLQKIIICHLVG